MNNKDITIIKAEIIDWLRRGTETFENNTRGYITEQERLKRVDFEIMLDEFIEILSEDIG